MKKADNFDAKQWLVENKITFQSRLNEDEEKRGFYVTMKPKDGSYGKSTLTNLPNHANQTYSGALRSIERLKDINGRKGKKYIYYVSDTDGNPLDKDGNIINEESRLNEAEEEKKYYITMKSKDGKGGGTLQNLPNHIRNTYSDALRSIEYLRNNFKKGKKYTYYVSDIDGNPVDEDGNIINEESRLNKNFQENYKYLELPPEDFKPGDFFLMAPDKEGEFFEHKEKVKILSIDLPKDGRSNTARIKTEDGKEMKLSHTSLYNIARKK
jgi:hypothetical protein